MNIYDEYRYNNIYSIPNTNITLIFNIYTKKIYDKIIKKINLSNDISNELLTIDNYILHLTPRK